MTFCNPNNIYQTCMQCLFHISGVPQQSNIVFRTPSLALSKPDLITFGGREEVFFRSILRIVEKRTLQHCVSVWYFKIHNGVHLKMNCDINFALLKLFLPFPRILMWILVIVPNLYFLNVYIRELSQIAFAFFLHILTRYVPSLHFLCSKLHVFWHPTHP